jgi:tetratricopeptide (TPR) repeat protein
MAMPEPSSSFQANLQRGELLRNQGRFAEAEKYLQQAVAEQPSNAEGHYELAICYCNWTGHGKKALETVDRAISLEPNRADFFSVRAWILGNLGRDKEAIRVADQALALNPANILALNAQTRAYNDLRDWKQSEAAARRTLAINPVNTLAANLLASSLRRQGKLRESAAVTADVLSRTPEDAMAQSNAGWAALEAGDHRSANEHFLDALRMNPDYGHAREGLLHSFNSRVWIYRVYFQFIAWLGRHKKGTRYFFLALIYIAYRIVVIELRKTFGEQAWYWILVVMALYLIIFGFGRSFGNLFLLLDPFARHALTAKEKRWSIFVGIFYGFILGFEILSGAWPQAAVLLAILAFFLWGVLSPRLKHAFSRKSADAIAD